MSHYIALLRAVNVTGHNRVRMQDLSQMLVELGLANPRSLLQSGNLLFECPRRPQEELEAELEEAARGQLGLETPFLVRDAEQWGRLVKANPFPEEASANPGHMLTMILKQAPGATALTAWQNEFEGPELLQAAGRQIYIVYPNGVGKSKLDGRLLEKRLGVVGTARNWNTVLKLADLVAP